MGQRKKPCAALDHSFLLLLEAGSADCRRILSRLETLRFDFIVPDAALQEVLDLQRRTSQPAVAELSQDLLRQLQPHGFKTSGLSGTDIVLAELFADKLLETRLISGAARNHPLVIAQAALHECDVLLTVDPVLLAVDGGKLNVALMDNHLSIIQILSPEQLLRALDQLGS